jgi:hypothetical protein
VKTAPTSITKGPSKIDTGSSSHNIGSFYGNSQALLQLSMVKITESDLESQLKSTPENFLSKINESKVQTFDRFLSCKENKDFSSTAEKLRAVKNGFISRFSSINEKECDDLASFLN